LDYKISDKITTGFFYRYSYRDPNATSNSDTNTTLSNPITKTIDSLIRSQSEEIYKKSYHNINYHFIYDIDTLERKLSFDFDFFDYRTSSNQTFASTNYLSDLTPISNSFDSGNNRGKQNINNYSFNLDMEHPFDWAVLNYGSRLSFIKNNSAISYYDLKSGVPILNVSLSDRFNYQEDIQSLYFSAQRSFGEKWEAKAGLRMENTELTGNSIILGQVNKTSYTELFPTAYLSFQANDNHSFYLDYSRRIARPNYGSLNPAKSISSPYSYWEGNPNLRPFFFHNIEFQYSFKDKWFNAFYFGYNDDGFAQITMLDETTNIERNTYLNFLTTKVFGTSQTLVLNPIPWWRFNFNANVSYQDTDSKIPDTPKFINGWNGYFSAYTTFTLNSQKTLFWSVNYLYITKGNDKLTTNSDRDELNTTITWQLFDKKMNIRLHINNILGSRYFDFTEYYNGIKSTFNNYEDFRYFQLSLSYSFGKSFEVRNRENKNDEERGRL